MWKRLGRKKCTRQGYNTTLTVIGMVPSVVLGPVDVPMVFCSVLLLILPLTLKAWYMSVILHKRDNWALNFCEIETPSQGWGGLFLQRYSSFHTGQRKRRGSKQRATSWHSRGGVTNSYNWNGVQVRTLLMLWFIVKLFSKNYAKRVSTEIFQPY